MIQVVNSKPEDLGGIARCHVQCFKASLSSQLGLAYTKKTFDWFLQNPNRFLFHVLRDNEIIGYCGGFVPQYIGDGSTSGIMQYTMRQALMGVVLHPWLLFHSEVINMYPLIFKNIKRKIFSPKKGNQSVTPVDAFEKRVGLVVIGVQPQHRGSGVFQLLMHEFEARAINFNIYKLALSVKKNNIRAIRAYTRQGWFIAKEHAQTLEMSKYIV